MMKRELVPISARAAIQRINRKLRDDNEQVLKARGDRARQELGEFYRIDVSRNHLVQKDIDLEKLGRELGALKAWERVAEEDRA
jgi:hypothetical protein